MGKLSMIKYGISPGSVTVPSSREATQRTKVQKVQKDQSMACIEINLAQELCDIHHHPKKACAITIETIRPSFRLTVCNLELYVFYPNLTMSVDVA